MNSLVEKNEPPKYWNVVIHSVVTFLGQSLMQVVDLLFCRDLGPNASATIGSATALLAWFIILGIGLISSLEYLIPNSLGEGNERRANEYFYAGFAVVLVVSAISTLGLLGLSALSPLYGMNADIIDPVQNFCLIVSTSYFPIFLTILFRVELQARGEPHATTYAYLYGNLFNILLNWMLVLGHLGFPALGLQGSAYANLISRYAIFAFLLWRIIQVRSKQSLHLKLNSIPYWERSKEIFKMGLPTSLHMLFEIGAFILVGMLASRLSPTQNAAHAIAISIASFAFMVPAGMSSAAALTISRALGEGNRALGIALGNKTIKLGLIYAMIGSLIFVFGRKILTLTYTSDPETFKTGCALLLIAGIFQFGDALQVILAGCIRGFGETKIQAKANAFGHWVIGVPLGILLGFHFQLGITGLWIGLCAGLFSVAILLFIRFKKISAS